VPIEERLRKSLDAVEDPADELRAAIERQGGDLTPWLGESPSQSFGRPIGSSPRLARLVSGVGPSAFLAGYAAFLFRRLGKDSAALTHAGFDGADELLSVKQGHAVVVSPTGGCTGTFEYSSRERRRSDPRWSSSPIR